MKKYKLAMLCGRFAHIHNGHKMIIDKGLELCEKVLVLVGSSQESHTLRNPFTADFRIELIKKVYNNNPNIRIEKLEDLTNEYDITYDWGQYVIDKTTEYSGQKADLIITGNDEMRKGWFSEEQMQGVTELSIDRQKIKISATELRGYILLNNKEEWQKYVPKEIITEFEKIRKHLLEVEIYRKILSEIGEEKTIENFKKVYEKYEIDDRERKIRNI